MQTVMHGTRGSTRQIRITGGGKKERERVKVGDRIGAPHNIFLTNVTPYCVVAITIGIGKLPQATDCSREWGSLSCVLPHTYRMWQLRALRCGGVLLCAGGVHS